MKVELKALTIDQIKEILGQNNLRGIANAVYQSFVPIVY